MVSERRLHPRYMLDVCCELCWESRSDGVQQRKVRTVNISMNGLQVRCDLEVAEVFQEQESFPAEARLTISLPDPFTAIIANARQVVRRRLAIDNFRLGFEFSEFEAESKQQLGEYLESITETG